MQSPPTCSCASWRPPLYGDAALMEAMPCDGCEALDACGRAKSICTAREIGMSLTQLESEMDQYTYGLHLCGEPVDEPSGHLASDEHDGVPTRRC